MEKEVLTHERILQDYVEIGRRHIKKLIFPLIFLVCISVLVVWLNIRIIVEEGIVFRIVLYSLLLLVGDFIFGAAIVTKYKSYQDIKNKRYYVVTDEVSGKQEEEIYYLRFLRAYSKPAEIKFRTYGGYFPDVTHTSASSDRFDVSDADNFFSAFNGDKFLLVIDKKSHILLVYNAKLFEYHG